MIGLALVDSNFNMAYDGKIIPGPRSDKQWLLSTIHNKVVLCGATTFEKDLKNFSLFHSMVGELIVVGSGYTDPREVNIDLVDFHLGGPSTFETIPPDSLIVHMIDSKAPLGSIKLKLPLDGYKLVAEFEKADYKELFYRRYNGE